MSRQAPPPCRSVLTWLSQRYGRSYLAPLTGQDRRALAVFIHAVELYGVSDEDGRRAGIAAMRAAVSAMQRTTREIAKKAIPAVLDWGDEDRVWKEIGWPDFGVITPPPSG